MELARIDIHELLPQKEPFVMVSRLVELDDVRTVCETDIGEDNLMAENGHLSASGLIENIAQTCAARIGYYNKYVLKKDVQIGFVGAIRNMEIIGLPEVGQMITTIVEVKEEVFGMTLASAMVIIREKGEKVLATAEMKIAVRNEE